MDTDKPTRLHRLLRQRHHLTVLLGQDRMPNRFLSVGTPAPGPDSDLLTAAILRFGKGTWKAKRSREAVTIRYPASWDRRRGSAAASEAEHLLAHYHAREPLLLDIARLLLLQQPRSRLLIESAATMFVMLILNAEVPRKGVGS